MQLFRERFSFRFENFSEAYSPALQARKNFQSWKKRFSKEPIPYPKLALISENYLTLFFLGIIDTLTKALKSKAFGEVFDLCVFYLF